MVAERLRSCRGLKIPLWLRVIGRWVLDGGAGEEDEVVGGGEGELDVDGCGIERGVEVIGLDCEEVGELNEIGLETK